MWLYPNVDMHRTEKQAKLHRFLEEHEVEKVIAHFRADAVFDGKPLDRHWIDVLENLDAKGWEVHGMINTLSSIPDSFRSDGYRDLYTVDIHGVSCFDEPIAGRRQFLDPNHPQVQDYVCRSTAAILQKVPFLRGIQLDFIRYYYGHSRIHMDTKQMWHNLRLAKGQEPVVFGRPGEGTVTYYPVRETIVTHDPPVGGPMEFVHDYRYCFCPRCTQSFAREHDLTLPTGDKTDIGQWILAHAEDAWYDFRERTLAALIRAIRQSIQDVDSTHQLSITHWYNAPYGNELLGQPLEDESERIRFGQAWWKWANEGLIDFLCPMNYWLQPDSFLDVLKTQKARLHHSVPQYAGLLTSRDYAISEAELPRYKEAAAEAGFRGLCFFHYGTWNR